MQIQARMVRNGYCRLWVASVALALCMVAEGKELLDFGWEFRQDSVMAWTPVQLPHDWDHAAQPSPNAPMGNDGGYYPGGIGHYRRVMHPAQQGQSLQFDGVYGNCRVWLNGRLATTHYYGYTPFVVPLEPGDTLVQVEVDNSRQPNCRWYSGSGIYRHVWLLGQEDRPQPFVHTVAIYGISPDGTRADSATVAVDGQLRTMRDIQLWSPDHPRLYDIDGVSHGFRQIEYSAERGLLLNGLPIVINGACVHHDNGLLGAMSYDAAEVRKVRLMKQAGFNLIRTAHNPPAPAMLHACDSLGMLVIDEIYDGWLQAKTPYDHHSRIAEDYAQDIEAMVTRDRNHPCIIAWSIGNEVIERKDIAVITTAKKLKAEVLRHDPTRPVTEALCAWDSDWEIYDPHAQVLDIVGYNYMIHKHATDHQRDPDRVMWQTESYPRDAYRNWQLATQYPYIIGDIVWTGLDYLGESGIGQWYSPGQPAGEHYKGSHFPWHGAYCGDVDITGWRKPISHYRDMLWNATKPIYMAVRQPGPLSQTLWSVWPAWESWNWQKDELMDVEVYTTAPKVQLWLNGTMVAESAVDSMRAVLPVRYSPGTLRAVALNADGTVVADTQLVTTGSPYAIRLTADKSVLAADGQDLAFVTIEVVDRQGRVVPDASVKVSLQASGACQLIASGSADMSDLEPLASPTVTTWHGRAMAVVRASRTPGRANLRATAPGLGRGTAVVKVYAIRAIN